MPGTAYINMKNPWNVFEAFQPMFCDKVEIILKPDSLKYTVDACVFPMEQVDPFVEVSNESNIKLMTVLLCKKCFPKNLKPKVGDSVLFENGEKYNISEISDEQTWWKCVTRSA